MLDLYDRNQQYSVASWGVGGGTAASDASTSDKRQSTRAAEEAAEHTLWGDA